MVEAGGDPWTPALRVVVSLVAGAALLVSGVGTFKAWTVDTPGAATAGSCWKESSGDEFDQVLCSAPHGYEAVATTVDPEGADCPASTTVLMELTQGGRGFLCLAPAVSGTSS